MCGCEVHHQGIRCSSDACHCHEEPNLYRKNPLVIQALQWKGNNIVSMWSFVGAKPTDEEYTVFGFQPMGTYLTEWLYEDKGMTGELWVEANQQWLPIETGEWVIKDDLGYYPCKEDKFNQTYKLALTEKEKELNEKLRAAINSCSAENESGTPDYLLAEFLGEVLQAFNNTVVDRASWRGENIELPSVTQLRKEHLEGPTH